jgi:enamine deaminase RidA (YjgF/YER057c/UK114 family)
MHDHQASSPFGSRAHRCLTASAQNTKRIPLPASQTPSNADLPDTTSQTVGIIKDIQEFLASQKLTLGDVVMMHVYLGAILPKTAKWTLPG